MKISNYFPYFRKSFSHPSIYFFILIVIAVILLTFLTNNNALEIAISGIASVFIGIGVNNLTTLETQSKDEQKIKSKMEHTLKLMRMAQTRIEIIQQKLNSNEYSGLKDELAELAQMINLGSNLIIGQDTLS